jgi:hypothetical protein
MAGSVARNPHTGSRSEILADYLFSGWGTVTPVRRQDDYGIDLQCTLTEPVGKRAVVTDYYSVQVKSGHRPWVFKSADDIKWLCEYPTPLFLACVDKAGGRLAIYHTIARFFAGMWPLPSRLKLTPTSLDDGESVGWTNGTDFSLSAPILRVSLRDFLDERNLDGLRGVLKYWVALDTFNCDLRRIGLLRFRMPHRYRVNEIPALGGFVEQGMTLPTDSQLARAVSMMVEAVDCVGDQLRVRGDRISALYAAMFLRHLKATRASDLTADPRWNLSRESPFEFTLSRELDAALEPGENPSYVFEKIDKLVNVFKSAEAISAYLNPRSNDKDL